MEGGEEAASGGAPAARGCSMEGEKRLFLGELPLRGAARWRGGGGEEAASGEKHAFLGSCRCAGLMPERSMRDEASISGNLPLRGAVGGEHERSIHFWGAAAARG